MNQLLCTYYSIGNTLSLLLLVRHAILIDFTYDHLLRYYSSRIISPVSNVGSTLSSFAIISASF